MKYVWRRGGTFTFGLEVVAGEVSGDEVVRCVLKPATKTGTSPGDAVADSVVFTVEFTPATESSQARWVFTGSAASSESLTPGEYVADARINIGDTVVQTAIVGVKVLERVTEPA